MLMLVVCGAMLLIGVGVTVYALRHDNETGEDNAAGGSKVEVPLKDAEKSQGIVALVCAFLSLFVLGGILAWVAVVVGGVGVFKSIQAKSKVGFWLNLSAVILGLVSKTLLILVETKKIQF